MQTKSTANKIKITPCIFSVLAATLAGSAAAQSNVTIFGVMDLSLTRGTGSRMSSNQLASGNLAASRLGFKGVEDLGGLKVGFWWEAGLNADTGTGQKSNTNNQPSGVIGTGELIFNRRSTLSIGADWGEVRVGRDYVPQYLNIPLFDAMDLSGSGTSQVLNSSISGPTLVRASNSISYLYGHPFNAANVGLGPRGFSGSGFQFHAMYYLGENVTPNNAPAPDISKDGNGYGARATYSTGKFTISAAVGETLYAAGNNRQNNVGASYDFGVVNLMGMYEWDSRGAVSARGWVAGAMVPVGKGTIRGAYSTYSTDALGNPTAKKLAFGYIHSLSKRTDLYGAVAHVSNNGASSSALNGALGAPGKSSNGVDFGIKHSF